MGQREVQSFLKECREAGDDYHPASFVIQSLSDRGLTNGSLKRVRFNLVQLEAYGFLDAKIDSSNGRWVRVWRLKKKYL